MTYLTPPSPSQITNMVHKMQNWKNSQNMNRNKLMHEMQNFENINAELAFF